jgi:hypothetical protein
MGTPRAIGALKETSRLSDPGIGGKQRRESSSRLKQQAATTRAVCEAPQGCGGEPAQDELPGRRGPDCRTRVRGFPLHEGGLAGSLYCNPEECSALSRSPIDPPSEARTHRTGNISLGDMTFLLLFLTDASCEFRVSL